MSGFNVNVNFGGQQTAERRTFINIPGVRATVLVSGNPIPQVVYGLLGCANDVRVGNFLTGRILFTATQVAQEAPAAPANTATPETVSETSPTLDSFLEVLPELIKQANASTKVTTLTFTSKEGAKIEMTMQPKATVKKKVNA